MKRWRRLGRLAPQFLAASVRTRLAAGRAGSGQSGARRGRAGGLDADRLAGARRDSHRGPVRLGPAHCPAGGCDTGRGAAGFGPGHIAGRLPGPEQRLPGQRRAAPGRPGPAAGPGPQPLGTDGAAAAGGHGIGAAGHRRRAGTGLLPQRGRLAAGQGLPAAGAGLHGLLAALRHRRDRRPAGHAALRGHHRHQHRPALAHERAAQPLTAALDPRLGPLALFDPGRAVHGCAGGLAGRAGAGSALRA